MEEEYGKRNEVTGLCLPMEEEYRRRNEVTGYPLGFGPNEEEIVQEPMLNPMGRAAVEMVWAGCMALSSFGNS
jgi:hypothetical protein